MRIRLEMPDRQERFEQEVETGAYRFVQEGLTNAIRHASAKEATVAVWLANSSLKISIEDDGVGFEPATVFAAGNSVGLPGMRERAELLGGELKVESAVGHGTRLTVTLPVGHVETS